MTAPAYLRLIGDEEPAPETPPNRMEPGRIYALEDYSAPGLTMYRYALRSGESVVVTLPTSLCDDEVLGTVWELAEAADALCRVRMEVMTE